jgi:hypothetical protein
MCEFFAKWWDLVGFLVLGSIHILSWVQLQVAGKLNQATQDDEARRSGAQMIVTSSAAGITAVSILVPASMLIVQLWSNSASLPIEVVARVVRGATWFLGSLFLGLFIVFLALLKSQTRDIRNWIGIGIPFGLQLLTLLFGMIWLILGLRYFLQAKGG